MSSRLEETRHMHGYTPEQVERIVLGCCLMPLGDDDQYAMVQHVMQALPEEAWADRRHWRIAKTLLTRCRPGSRVDLEDVVRALSNDPSREYVENLAYRWADTAQLLPMRVKWLRAAFEDRNRGKAEAQQR